MSLIRDQILRYPAEQRLETALNVLEGVLGQSQPDVMMFLSYGLTEVPARFAACVNAAQGELVAGRDVFRAVYGLHEEFNQGKLLIASVRIREVLPGFLSCVRGQGYRALYFLTPQSPDVARARRINRCRTWTKLEDAELLRMRGTDSDWWAISEELERSEEDCKNRLAVLRAEIVGKQS